MLIGETPPAVEPLNSHVWEIDKWGVWRFCYTYANVGGVPSELSPDSKTQKGDGPANPLLLSLERLINSVTLLNYRAVPTLSKRQKDEGFWKQTRCVFQAPEAPAR